MTRRTSWAVSAVCLLLFGLLTAPVAAQAAAPSVPNGFAKRAVVKGLKAPIDMAFAPDGRLFVLEQAGRVRIVRPDGTLSTFLNIKTAVDNTAGRGLLGIAFDPDFETNNHLYLDYTRKANSTRAAHTVVVRVTADGNKAVPGSERQLLRLDRHRTPNHTGGALEFGSDGRLYVSTGDNERQRLPQRLRSTMGKILRINKDGSIPTNNPFFDRLTGRKRAIWARGLRNPFKMDVSPSTGAMFVNDVGEDTWEEINRARRGANYGWPKVEGIGTSTKYRSPIFTYGHGFTGSTGCAITGGAFYEPAAAQFPAAYVGDYFYSDYCTGWVRRYDPVTNTSHRFAKGFTKPALDIETGPRGALFLLLRSGSVGKIVKIVHP
jgi:glucose/arabinose dehydrogenase